MVSAPSSSESVTLARLIVFKQGGMVDLRLAGRSPLHAGFLSLETAETSRHSLGRASARSIPPNGESPRSPSGRSCSSGTQTGGRSRPPVWMRYWNFRSAPAATTNIATMPSTYSAFPYRAPNLRENFMSAPFRSKPQKPSRHGVGGSGADNIPPTGGLSLVMWPANVAGCITR